MRLRFNPSLQRSAIRQRQVSGWQSCGQQKILVHMPKDAEAAFRRSIYLFILREIIDSADVIELYRPQCFKLYGEKQ